jgi:hypothetical protein
MRRAVPLLAVVAIFAWQGCRQIAGIEDLEPADAASTQDGPTSDAKKPVPDAGIGDGAGGDGAGICQCEGCVELASALNSPLSLTVVGSDIYFLNYGPEDGTGSLMSVPTKGGKKRTVLGGLTRPFSLVTDGANLYFQAQDGTGAAKGVLVKYPIGGTPQTLAAGLGELQGLVSGINIANPTTNDIAVTPTNVYFVEYAPAGFDLPKGILSVSQEGGTVTAFASLWPNDGGPTYEGGPNTLSTYAIVTDGVALYATSILSEIGVLKIPLGGGPSEALVANLTAPYALALTGNEVIFCDDAINLTAGSIQSIPEDGGAPTILSKSGAVWAMVADTAKNLLYFIDPGGSVPAAIKSFDLGTHEVKTVLPELAEPVSLAIDSQNVYWTDAFCGTVVSAPR